MTPLSIIYDNSPNASAVNAPNIIYKHDAKNNGVSKAYNNASALAVQMNKKWMLLVDQDSEITPFTFFAYQTAVLANENHTLFVPNMQDQIGIISPFIFFKGKGLRVKSLKPGVYSHKKYKVINTLVLFKTNSDILSFFFIRLCHLKYDVSFHGF